MPLASRRRGRCTGVEPSRKLALPLDESEAAPVGVAHATNARVAASSRSPARAARVRRRAPAAPLRRPRAGPDRRRRLPRLRPLHGLGRWSRRRLDTERARERGRPGRLRGPDRAHRLGRRPDRPAPAARRRRSMPAGSWCSPRSCSRSQPRRPGSGRSDRTATISSSSGSWSSTAAPSVRRSTGPRRPSSAPRGPHPRGADAGLGHPAGHRHHRRRPPRRDRAGGSQGRDRYPRRRAHRAHATTGRRGRSLGRRARGRDRGDPRRPDRADHLRARRRGRDGRGRERATRGPTSWTSSPSTAHRARSSG